MEQIPEALRTELKTDEQTSGIIKKLDDNTSTQGIWNLLLKIFEEEGLGIIKKLTGSPEDEPDEVQLRRSFESDFTAFKEAEHLFKLILSKPNYMDKEAYASNISVAPSQNPAEDTNRYLSVSQINQNSTSKISNDNLSYNPTPLSMKISIRNQSASTVNNGGRRSMSVGNKGFQPPKAVSKIDDSFYERLTAKQSRHRIDTDNFNNVSIQLPYINKSKLLKEPHRKQYYRIQSEFNHIKGSVKFGNTKRKVFEAKQFSPGPANYSLDSSRTPLYTKAPNTVIGKAGRKTWIEQAIADESPGPAYFYPSKHLCLK